MDFMRSERERLADILHTLGHAGVEPDKFKDCAREAVTGNDHFSEGFREAARTTLSNMGIDPDVYISDHPIDIEVIEPPLPDPILQALGNLGTSEPRLIRLEAMVH